MFVAKEGPMLEFDATVRMLLEDFHETILPSLSKHLVKRDLTLGRPFEPKVGNLVKVVVGMRRVGKTFRLYQEILALVDSGVSLDRICYFNFDDDRIRPYDDKVIGRVLELFFEIHPETRREGVYVFFDEVQEVPNWGITVRRIVDTEKATLYLSGSSSKLLSTDIATEIRGRAIDYELLPFSFKEYARVHGIEPQGEADLNNKEKASTLKGAFKRYLVEGGFPGVQELDDIERAQVLQTYAQFTVARDIVERNKLPNAAFARNLARIALASSGRDFSISKIHNSAKSTGYSPGRAAITEILEAFEDAHLLFGVYEFTYSAQKIRLGGYKLYAVDPGMLYALSPASNDGMTRSLETAVYLELRRRRRSTRMGSIALAKTRSGKEVDFVEGDEALGQIHRLVQVCLNMSDDATRVRETSALQEAMEQFGVDEAIIVTLEEEAIIEIPEGKIRVVPAWKWFSEI